MGTKETRNEYIHQYARTAAGQLGIQPKDWSDTDGWPEDARKAVLRYLGTDAFTPQKCRRALAMALQHRYGVELLERTRALSDETKGKLAACGLPWEGGQAKQTPLIEVNDLSVGVQNGGDVAITALAQRAIIAALTDNLIADLAKIGQA